jgi:hypothetical protein
MLPVLGILLTTPSLIYLALITAFGGEAAERADAPVDVVVPVVFWTPVLAPLSLVVALVLFVCFLHRRVSVAVPLIWLVSAVIHALAARDLAARMDSLWKAVEALLRW